MWYKAKDRMPVASDRMIGVLFNDNCTCVHYTFIDGHGWCDAEDCYSYKGNLDEILYWCHAPEKFQPAFMEWHGD